MVDTCHLLLPQSEVIHVGNEGWSGHALATMVEEIEGIEEGEGIESH